MSLSAAGQASWSQDAATSYYNPAGMSRLSGSHFTLGAGFVDVTGKTNLQSNANTGGTGGNSGVDLPFSSIFLKVEGKGKFDYGLCLVAPYGLSIDYDSGYAGSLLIKKLEFSSPQINPSISYEIDEQWSVAIGLGLQYATLETLQQLGAVDIEREYDDFQIGYNLGLMWTSEDLQIGFTYRSMVDHDMEGDRTIAGTSINSSVGVKTPAIWDLGFRYQVGKNRWFMDIGMTQWSVTQNTRFNDAGTITTVPRNFHNACRVGIGLERPINNKLTWRGGISWDQDAVDDEYRAPDVIFDHQWRFSTGANYKLKDNHSIDLAYQYADLGKNKTNLAAADFLGVDLQGEVDASWHFLSMQWNYLF